ncbi:HNH endonuclease signature motif containing protein [Mesoplasma syrphidae]|nr:HNH endonuclease signature motif containing protein [Mesoplasma syrphidae]
MKYWFEKNLIINGKMTMNIINFYFVDAALVKYEIYFYDKKNKNISKDDIFFSIDETILNLSLFLSFFYIPHNNFCFSEYYDLSSEDSFLLSLKNYKKDLLIINKQQKKAGNFSELEMAFLCALYIENERTQNFPNKELLIDFLCKIAKYVGTKRKLRSYINKLSNILAYDILRKNIVSSGMKSDKKVQITKKQYLEFLNKYNINDLTNKPVWVEKDIYYSREGIYYLYILFDNDLNKITNYINNELMYKEEYNNDLTKQAGNELYFSEKISCHSALSKPEIFNFDKMVFSRVFFTRIRNKTIVNEYLKNNKICEFCLKTETFIKEKDQMYFEVHHFIPCNIKIQNQYKNNLDNFANLLSLCPECHRKIHFSIKEVREEMIKKLYYEKFNKNQTFKKYFFEENIEKIIRNYSETFNLE